MMWGLRAAILLVLVLGVAHCLDAAGADAVPSSQPYSLRTGSASRSDRAGHRRSSFFSFSSFVVSGSSEEGEGSGVGESVGRCGAEQPGFARHAGTDFGGEEILKAFVEGNLQSCILLCSVTTGCTGFVYFESQSSCSFRSSWGSAVASPGMDAYVACTQPDGRPALTAKCGSELAGFHKSENTDCVGSDLVVKQASLKECATLCTDDERCVGFTFSTSSPKRSCTLKSAWSMQAPTKGVTLWASCEMPEAEIKKQTLGADPYSD